MNQDIERRVVPTGSKTRIQSVARAARLLRWVATQTDAPTVREIAESQGLRVPTTYHLINTLVDEGLLARDSRGHYVPGEAIAVLVPAYFRRPQLSDRMTQILKELVTRTEETVYVADWGSDGIRVLASLEGSQIVRVADVGNLDGPYENAHARANGKVLLAHASEELRERYLAGHELRRLTPHTITSRAALDTELDRVREDGVAYDREESQAGITCLAAPLLYDGALVAAFGLLVPTERFGRTCDSLRDSLLDVLQRAASTR